MFLENRINPLLTVFKEIDKYGNGIIKIESIVNYMGTHF